MRTPRRGTNRAAGPSISHPTPMPTQIAQKGKGHQEQSHAVVHRHPGAGEDQQHQEHRCRQQHERRPGVIALAGHASAAARHAAERRPKVPSRPRRATRPAPSPETSPRDNAKARRGRPRPAPSRTHGPLGGPCRWQDIARFARSDVAIATAKGPTRSLRRRAARRPAPQASIGRGATGGCEPRRGLRFVRPWGRLPICRCFGLGNLPHVPIHCQSIHRITGGANNRPCRRMSTARPQTTPARAKCHVRPPYDAAATASARGDEQQRGEHVECRQVGMAEKPRHEGHGRRRGGTRPRPLTPRVHAPTRNTSATKATAGAKRAPTIEMASGSSGALSNSQFAAPRM